MRANTCQGAAPARAGDGPSVGAARGERLDAQAVIGRAHEPLERRALERGVDQLAPILRVAGGKVGGERQGLGVCHRLKMPRRACRPTVLPCNWHAGGV